MREFRGSDTHFLAQKVAKVVHASTDSDLDSLVSRMAAGDREAVGTFLSLYGPMIRRRVRGKLRMSVRRLFDSQDILSTVGRRLDTIVREAIATKPYVWGTHHLPHDVMVRELSTGRSRYETLRSLGLSQINVGTAANPEERVNAARLMIPICWFDAERCARGLEQLRAYRKRWNKANSAYSGPLHDKSSHGADAFGEFAMNRLGTARTATTQPARRFGGGGAQSWMG